MEWWIGSRFYDESFNLEGISHSEVKRGGNPSSLSVNKNLEHFNKDDYLRPDEIPQSLRSFGMTLLINKYFLNETIVPMTSLEKNNKIINTMKFLDLAKQRYSCREYDSRPVEQEKLNLILEAGRIAPSAANCQPWHFIVIREKENLERIHPVYHRDWFMAAPCVIIICGDHSQSWKRKDEKDHCDIDVAIAVDHITLQAAELGLGTCWICNFEKDLCSELLNLPPNLEPAVILPMGYPLDSADPDRHISKRKSINEIVSYEKYI